MANNVKQLPRKKETTEEFALKVSTLAELQQESKGKVIEIAGFDGITPIKVKVKPVSLMAAIAGDSIPNELLSKAVEVFEGQPKKEPYTRDKIIEMYDMLIWYARTCLVEPTYQELEEAGIELTDFQLMDIYHFAREGQAALSTFRGQSELKAFADLMSAFAQKPVGDHENKE